VSSFISAVLGVVFPGPGAIYLSQTSNFRAPVYLGDTITATVEIVHIREDKPVVTFSTTCTNQDGQLVVDGQAVLLCP
jgi:3-hydroxybutyryl-CoA dehydratase